MINDLIVKGFLIRCIPVLTTLGLRVWLLVWNGRGWVEGGWAGGPGPLGGKVLKIWSRMPTLYTTLVIISGKEEADIVSSLDKESYNDSILQNAGTLQFLKAHFHFNRNSQNECDLRVLHSKRLRIQYTLQTYSHEFRLFIQPMKSVSF